jgi:hypothetical protein
VGGSIIRFIPKGDKPVKMGQILISPAMLLAEAGNYFCVGDTIINLPDSGVTVALHSHGSIHLIEPGDQKKILPTSWLSIPGSEYLIDYWRRQSSSQIKPSGSKGGELVMQDGFPCIRFNIAFLRYLIGVLWYSPGLQLSQEK